MFSFIARQVQTTMLSIPGETDVLLPCSIAYVGVVIANFKVHSHVRFLRYELFAK